jgi:hypothetical protein
MKVAERIKRQTSSKNRIDKLYRLQIGLQESIKRKRIDFPGVRVWEFIFIDGSKLEIRFYYGEAVLNRSWV